MKDLPSHVALCASLTLAFIAGSTFGAAPNKPFPQHADYTAHTLKPINHNKVDMDQDIKMSYDRWKANYLSSAGTGRYRVKESRDATAGTSSESQGYGLILITMMAGYDSAAQSEVDGLLSFYVDHPSSIDMRLMDQHVPADESSEPGKDNSSFFGDAQLSFGLLQAEAQWGNAGTVNYGAVARNMIAGMKASELGPTSHLPLLGDWVLKSNLSQYNEFSVRSSDILPGHMRAFATATGDSTWLTSLAAQQNVADFMLAAFSSKAGLLPDYIVYGASRKGSGYHPAPANYMQGPLDGLWSTNAAKVPLSLGMDALLTQDDYSTRRAKWTGGTMRTAVKGNPMLIKAGYRLTGKPAPKIKNFSTLFAAPLAVAEMNDICPEALAYINNAYEVIRNSNEGFEGDTVSLISMLVMTANWWNP